MLPAMMRLLPILVGVLFALGAAVAQDYRAGSLEIRQPWARATPAAAKAGAGYLTIVNRGSEPDRLTGAECACAGMTMLHRTRVENDIARMEHVDAVEIPAGGEVRLAPGGLHVMFMRLKAPFREGERIAATLFFARAGRVEVEFAVESLSATEPSHEHAH